MGKEEDLLLSGQWPWREDGCLKRTFDQQVERVLTQFSPQNGFLASHITRGLRMDIPWARIGFFLFPNVEVFSCGFIVASFCHMPKSVFSFKSVLLD